MLVIDRNLVRDCYDVSFRQLYFGQIGLFIDCVSIYASDWLLSVEEVLYKYIEAGIEGLVDRIVEGNSNMIEVPPFWDMFFDTAEECEKEVINEVAILHDVIFENFQFSRYLFEMCMMDCSDRGMFLREVEDDRC